MPDRAEDAAEMHAHHRVPVVAVGECRSTGSADGIDDLTGWPTRRTGPVDLGAQVVDDDVCSLPGELERVTAADASPRSRDDHGPARADAIGVLTHGLMFPAAAGGRPLRAPHRRPRRFPNRSPSR